MFNHLHVHTEFSALDGLAKIEDLIIKAKELGQTAIAITDHGSTSGLYEASKLSKKHNFKVLYGSEFYFENSNSERKAGHLILIAKNNEGLANLFKLQAMAYIDNFYYKPRINLEMLQSNHEGLICLSACVANQIAQFILHNEPILALSHLCSLKSIFGEDFYLEIQSSTLEDPIEVNKVYADWIADGLAKPIITNDVHYVDKNDWYAHEVMLAIQQTKKMDDEKRWKFETHDYWLKSEEEIRADLTYIDENIIDCGINNIQEIIDKCDVEFETGNYLPSYKNLSKEEEAGELHVAICEGIINKIKPRGEYNEEFINDIRKEQKIIEETGYCGYFLIVSEYVNWARDNGILVGDGRGSGAGSKVAYTLGITEINPQKYGLLFERFLSPGREPDFDVDFSDIDAVYKHLQEVYGNNNVARVGALSTLTAKSAMRKVLSTFGMKQKEITELVTHMPNRISFTMKEALDESVYIKKFFKEHNDWLNVILKLEGNIDHFSTHAGGIIIGKDLSSKLPIMVDRTDTSKLVIGLDKDSLHEMGYYKFDVLGLISLSLIKQTIDYIGNDIDWFGIGNADPKIYEMLAKGNVYGVFQLSEQKDKVIEQAPNCFEDLIAINALIRPGVGDWNEYINRRRSGEHKSNTTTPYLDSTSGIIVYQEQYLLLANTYAGWDIAYSDKHIRKNRDIKSDIELKEKFYKDCETNGYNDSIYVAIWNDICDVVSNGYGFNRSHSCSYAMLTYQTAWLKFYFPKEFYASLLTIEGSDTNAINTINEELKELQISLLPPDINKSGTTFLPIDDGILYKLTSIDGIGVSAIAEINKLKPIKSLKDFIERRTPKFVKINGIVNLIKAGCFDFENQNRFEMLAKLQTMVSSDFEFSLQPNYVYEKDSMSIYLSDSPYEKYSTKDFDEYENNKEMVTIGEVTDITEILDKNSNPMAFLIITNKHGSFKAICFTKLWKETGIRDIITLGNIIVLRGRKDKSSLLLNSVDLIE